MAGPRGPGYGRSPSHFSLTRPPMPSLIAHSMKLFSRLYIRTEAKDPASLVAHLRRSMNHSPIPVLLPKGVKAEPWQAGGLRGDRLVVASPSQVILYLHGGGYVCGRTRTYFNFCGRLARELHAEVLLPAYRLAPEHPFPAAIEDAVASYEWLLQRGWRPDQITLAGDSAGGGLTLGTLLALRDQGRPLPRCAVTISPFADVRSIAPSVRGNDATDYMLSAHMLETGRPLYAQTPADAIHPYASPALGDFTGLPPLFITVCDHECLRDDAYAVEARALAAGVPVTLLSRPELMHVWPIFVPLLPEANEDLARIANFIRGAGRTVSPGDRPGDRIVPLNAAGAATLAPAAKAKAAPGQPGTASKAATAAGKTGAGKAGAAKATGNAKAPGKPATPTTTPKGKAGGKAKTDGATAARGGKGSPAGKDKPAAKTPKTPGAPKAGSKPKTDKPAAAGKGPAPKPRSLSRPEGRKKSA